MLRALRFRKRVCCRLRRKVLRENILCEENPLWSIWPEGIIFVRVLLFAARSSVGLTVAARSTVAVSGSPVDGSVHWTRRLWVSRWGT